MEDKIVAVPGSVLARGLQRWRSMLHWVRDVPVADPVDRRNAPMLQLVSFLLAVLPSAAWCYRALLVDIPWRPGEVTGMVFGLSVSAISALSLVLVRKGKFRAASHALLAVFAATVIPAYLVAGFGGQRFEQPVLAIWMAIAALAVGRMALWLMFLCIAAAFGLGIAVDIDKQGQAVELLGDAAFSTAIFLMIAVVLDRSSVALRESLREARARGDALDVANRRLTEEMAERERTFAQLVQAQKMEAVGRLASGVAHDFGNVLAVAGGYVRSGLRAGDAAHMRESLVGVDSAVNRANLLTRRLLSLARAEDGVEEWFDPGEALKALVPMIRQLMGPDVKVDVVLGADLPALFSNNDTLANQWLQAGDATRDPLWRMPLWRPYLRYLNSHVADLANAGSRMAGSVTAALYLERFLEDGQRWAHLDVYAWNDGERPGRPAGGEALALRSAWAMLKARYS